MYCNKEIFCGHFFGPAGPKGVINDWRRFKLDNIDQTVPQSKRELLRQMSSPREDDKERLNRKVDVNTHRTLYTEKKIPFWTNVSANKIQAVLQKSETKTYIFSLF